jgi:sodium/potassium-transporting ATPase subunit alpha
MTLGIVYNVTDVASLPIHEAVSALVSTPNGLTSNEAERRLRVYGPNRVERVRRQPWLLRLLQEFVQFFSIILWIAAVLAFLGEWIDPGAGMARIGYALVVVILISGTFSFWQENRNERTLEELGKLLPQEVKVLRDCAISQLPIDQIVPGDVIILESGDNIPADCRLIEAFDVSVNDSTITGESLPKARDAQPYQDVQPLRSRNILLAGTSLVAGEGRALVIATAGQTEFGRIAHLAQISGAGISPLRRELAHLSRLIAVLAVGLGATFFVIGTMIGVPFWQDFIFSIGIIVAIVPEGLLPTLTLALVLAAQRMARRKVLVRHLTSVETLGAATVICTDKTGTLTENRMHVRDVVVGLERLSANALRHSSGLVERQRDFFLAAALCHHLHEAKVGGRKILLGDPMEAALLEMARVVLIELPPFHPVDEVSFDAERMRQSMIYEIEGDRVLYCKGAPEKVLSLCADISEGGSIQSLDSAMRAVIVQRHEQMAEQGLRVLAFAKRDLPIGCKHSDLERDLVFLGLVGLVDPPRPDVPEAIAKCRDAGIKVIMVTGDHPLTAAAIAREIGLAQSHWPKVITGSQLDSLSESELQFTLDAPEIVFARIAADQKMRIVEALKKKQHVVAVTGDGVNDAPALKSAHIGIAMGLSGTDVAKQAADIVLLDDNFSGIVSAIEEGRAIFQNIRKFLTYVLVHDVAELVPYLAFGLFRIPLPLTPIQALSVDMGSDSLTALGLGAERPSSSTMCLPPRSQSERLLNWPLALRAYLFLGIIEATAAMASYFFVLLLGGWRFPQGLAPNDPLYLSATTACLSAIIVMQVANVFICRSSVRSIFSMSFTDNKLILWGVFLELGFLLLINFNPWANMILGTAPVPPSLWLFILPFAFGMIALDEGRKWLVRKRLGLLER